MYATIINSSQQANGRLPNQFSDYMNQQTTRFSDICKLYLEGMTMDDIKYLTPEDLINLVPSNQYQHKLLMTIMVRRHLSCLFDSNNTTCENNNINANYDIVFI
jgi:hypothetical protein